MAFKMQEETTTTTTPDDLAPALRKALDHTIYLAKRTFKDGRVTQGEFQKICTSPLLIRALHKAHTINLLTKEGLLEEAEIILRVLLEVSFVVCAVAKSPQFAERYGVTSFAQRRKRAQNFLRAVEQFDSIPRVTPSAVEKAKKQIEAYDAAIKHLGAKPLRIVDYAEEAGLLGDYYSSYSEMCSSVHSGPEDLEAYFHVNSLGRIVAIRPPAKNNAEILLVTAIEAMVRILKATCAVFGVSITELAEVERLYKQVMPIVWSGQLAS